MDWSQPSSCWTRCAVAPDAFPARLYEIKRRQTAAVSMRRFCPLSILPLMITGSANDKGTRSTLCYRPRPCFRRSNRSQHMFTVSSLGSLPARDKTREWIGRVTTSPLQEKAHGSATFSVATWNYETANVTHCIEALMTAQGTRNFQKQHGGRNVTRAISDDQIRSEPGEPQCGGRSNQSPLRYRSCLIASVENVHVMALSAGETPCKLHHF